MPNPLANIARQLDSVRERFTGFPVAYDGESYTMHWEETSGANAGESGIPAPTRQALNAFIASTDPHVLSCSASYWAPTTSTPVPMEGAVFVINGLNYVVTHTTFDNAGGSAGAQTVMVKFYVLRQVF